MSMVKLHYLDLNCYFSYICKDSLVLSARTHLLGGGIVVRFEFAYCLIFLG